MKEYIEREALMDGLKEIHDYVMQDPDISKAMKWQEAVCHDRAMRMISAATAADVVERKHGEWVHTTIEDEDWGGTYHRWTCSVCGGRVSGNPAGSNFCKWCGADMRGEKNAVD